MPRKDLLLKTEMFELPDQVEEDPCGIVTDVAGRHGVPWMIGKPGSLLREVVTRPHGSPERFANTYIASVGRNERGV